MNLKVIFIVILLLAPIPLRAQSISEIPVPTLPDVAMAAFDQFGRPVIYYNPIITRQIGPIVSEFFRAHEYGHHVLGHLRREFFEANPWNRAWIRQGYEKEADCYAAKNVPPNISQAAIQFFASLQGPTRPDWYHPTGYERANVIRRCAFGR